MILIPESEFRTICAQLEATDSTQHLHDLREAAIDTSQTCFVDVCWDFDGCIHSYTSGWIEADQIPDPPVPGVLKALYHYIEDGLRVAIFSARSAEDGGIAAMKAYIEKHATAIGIPTLVNMLEFPYVKPAAKVYIDDRGVRFLGNPLPTKTIEAYYRTWNSE